MKKIWGMAALSLALGANSILFAQDGPKQPPTGGQERGGKFSKRGPDGPGGRGEMRGMRRGGGFGDRDRGPRGGMRGGFTISDEELFKLNLTNDQKVKLFDFKKKMADERAAARQNFKPGERAQKPQGNISRDEMRQLMSAKQLGTLTAEQKAKLDSMESERKQMADKRKAEMDQRKAKAEQTRQEYLNIFTLDQRKQLEQMRADKAAKMQERMKQMQERRKAGNKKPAGQPKTDN